MSRPITKAPAKALFATGAARFYLVLLLLSLTYLVGSLTMGSPVVDGRLSPSFFPLLIGIGATVLCLSQWLAELKKPLEEAADESEQEMSEGSDSLSLMQKMARMPSIWMMVAIGVYIAAFSFLGYWLSSVLYVLAVMVMFAGRKHLLSKALIALAITAIGYLMFSELFNVRLPLLWE